MSWGRVWFAFEAAPGRTLASTVDLSGHFRALVEACRRADGTIDQQDFGRWVDVLVEHSHEVGSA